jgi:Tfp pilus assembly protein PilZ
MIATPPITEKVETSEGWIERPVRADFPVLVSFSADTFAVREFTLDVSEGGMFVPTDKLCPAGTRGTLKFRLSQYEEPIVVHAEVARVVQAGIEHQGGLGIRFLDLTGGVLDKLRELVDGVHRGTVVESIRKGLLASGRTLAQELHSRPIDQKMMLAASASGPEIDALIRDGNASVLLRLLDNPRLTQGHVVAMLRDGRLTTRVLSAIRGKGKLLTTAEARCLFCVHLNANLAEAIEQVRLLGPDQLRRVAGNPQVKPQIRVQAQELTRQPRGVRSR